MKRWLVTLIIVIAAFAGVMLAIALVLRSAIKGTEKDKIIASLGEKMGVPISVATVDLDLSQWFHFRPAVALGDVTIGNPPGFRSKNLVTAKTISARVALFPLFHKRVEVQSIVVNEPEIVVETNEKGLTNIEAFLKKISSNPGAGNGNGAATNVSVGEFSVTSGVLTYPSENLSLHDIELLVQGFSTDRPCHISLSAKYASGSASGFKLEGHAGPFNSDSLPLDATLALTIAPAEIPAALRREQFGVMLSMPGAKARAELQASIKGDVYNTVSGPARLTLSNIMIGGHQDHLVALAGEAPSNFTATNLTSNPQFNLSIPDAKLQLGRGRWTGGGVFGLHKKVISGTTHGAIRDIDINEFLSCFTSGGGKVFGLLAMPSSALQFSGRNAAEMLNSLKGTAKLSVTQGRLAALDVPATLERVFGNPDSTAATNGVTSFSNLSAAIDIGQRKMNVSDLLMESPAVRLTGNGAIGFDESINFALVAHVSGGRLGQLISTGPLHIPNVSAGVPLTVTGTVDSPQVHPQVGKIAKAAVEETVRGIVGGFLKKKLQPQQ